MSGSSTSGTDSDSHSSNDFLAGVAAALVSVVGVGVLAACFIHTRRNGVSCGPLTILPSHQFQRLELPDAQDIEAQSDKNSVFGSDPDVGRDSDGSDFAPGTDVEGGLSSGADGRSGGRSPVRGGVVGDDDDDEEEGSGYSDDDEPRRSRGRSRSRSGSSARSGSLSPVAGRGGGRVPSPPSGKPGGGRRGGGPCTLVQGAHMSFVQFEAFWERLHSTDMFRAAFSDEGGETAVEQLEDALTGSVGMQRVVPEAGDAGADKSFFSAEDEGGHSRVLLQATDVGGGEVSILVKSSGDTAFLEAAVTQIQAGLTELGEVLA